MSKNFIRFKRRARIQAIFAAVLLSMGAALAVLAVITTVFKLYGAQLSWIYYADCLGVGVIGAVVLYFVFMPSDVRLAKRLDSLYLLDEKISTMLELRSDQGLMAELQREDADEKLSQTNVKLFKSKQLLAGILVFCIAIGSVVGSVLIPAKADDGELPMGEFDKQWLMTAIEELISMVEIAYIDDGLKQTSLEELQELYADVEATVLFSEMKESAVDAVIGINKALQVANPAESIGERFSESTNESISALGRELKALSGSGAKKAMESLGDKLKTMNSDDAAFVADEMNSCLQSSGVRLDDDMYLTFKTLIASVKVNNSLASKEFTDAGKELSPSVLLQNVNRATMNVVINKLCSLFGITENDITTVDPEINIEINKPSDKNENTGDTNFKEPDTEIGSGGLGTGNIIYGSDDQIFDPYTGTYRPYGEVIHDYFARINEYITDGKVSDEMEQIINDYFDILFSGTNNDEKNK